MSRYKKLKPIGEYIIDKEEMIEQVFASIPIIEVRNMVPIKLQGMPLHELKAECMVELLAMSDREILDVLEGRKVRDAESSESGSETVFVISDEEKRIKREKKDFKASKVVTDDRSSAERSSSSRKKKKKRVKKEVDDKIEPKTKKKKRQKDKEEALPSSSNGPKTSATKTSGKKKKNASVEGKPTKPIDDDVMILEEISSDEGEVVVKEKVQEKSLLDLLELEMRARAIRSLLKKEDDVRAQKFLSEYQDEPDDLIPVIEEHPKIEILSDSDDDGAKLVPSNIRIEMHLDGNNLCSKDVDVLDSLLGIGDKSIANTAASSTLQGETSPIHIVDDESAMAGGSVIAGEPAVLGDSLPSASDQAPGVPAQTTPATKEQNKPKSGPEETTVESVAIKEEPLDDDPMQKNSSLPEEIARVPNPISIKAEAPPDTPDIGDPSIEKNQELISVQDQGPSKIDSSTNSNSKVDDVSVPKPISFSIKKEPCSPERNETASIGTESRNIDSDENGQTNAGTEDIVILEKSTPHDVSENSMGRRDSMSPLLEFGDPPSNKGNALKQDNEPINASMEVETMDGDKSESAECRETISISGSAPDDSVVQLNSEANELILSNEDFRVDSANSQCEETNLSEPSISDQTIMVASNSEATSSALGVDNGSTVVQEDVEVNRSKNDPTFLEVGNGSPGRAEKIHENEIFLGEPSTFDDEELTHRKSARNEDTKISADMDPPDGTEGPLGEEQDTPANELKSGNHFLGVTEGSVETDVCDSKSPLTTSCLVVEIPSFAEPSDNKLISTLPTTRYDSCAADDLAICSQFDDDALDYDDGYISLIPDPEISEESQSCGPTSGFEHVDSDGQKVSVDQVCHTNNCIDLISEDGDIIGRDLDAKSGSADVSITTQPEKIMEPSVSVAESPELDEQKLSPFYQRSEQCQSFIDLSRDEEIPGKNSSAGCSSKWPQKETRIDLEEHSGDEALSHPDTQDDLREHKAAIDENQEESCLGCIDLLSDDEGLNYNKQVLSHCTEGGTESAEPDVNNSVCVNRREDVERNSILEKKCTNAVFVASTSSNSLEDSMSSFPAVCQQVLNVDQSYGCINLMSDEDEEPLPIPGKMDHPADTTQTNADKLSSCGESEASRLTVLASVVSRKTATPDIPGMGSARNDCIDLMSDGEEGTQPNVGQLKHPGDKSVDETQSHSGQQSPQQLTEDPSPNPTELVRRKTETTIVPVVTSASNHCVDLLSDEDEVPRSNNGQLKLLDDNAPFKPQPSFDQQLLSEDVNGTTLMVTELVDKNAAISEVPIVSNESDCIDLMSDDGDEFNSNACQSKQPEMSNNIDQSNPEPERIFSQNIVTVTTSSLPKRKPKERVSLGSENYNCIDLMSDEELLDKIELERTVQSSGTLLSNSKADELRSNLEPLHDVSLVNQQGDVPNDEQLANNNIQVVEEAEELEEGEIVDDSDEVPDRVLSLSDSDSYCSRSSYSYCSTCSESSSGRSISSYESYRRSRRQKNAERVIARKTQHRKPRSWRDRRRRRSSSKETKQANSDPTPQNKEIAPKTLLETQQHLLDENHQAKDSKASKPQEDIATKPDSPSNSNPAIETITIEDDYEINPSKEAPMEVIDLDEDEDQKSNWTARWLDSNNVKKALQASKILANARKKLKLKLKSKNEEEPVEKELPKASVPLQLIGSVEEYRQLVKDGTIRASSATAVLGSDATKDDAVVASCDMPNDTAELTAKSDKTPNVSIQPIDEVLKESKTDGTNPSQESELNQTILRNTSDGQLENCVDAPQTQLLTNSQNDLISEQTKTQSEPLVVCRIDNTLPIASSKKISESNSEDRRSENIHLPDCAPSNSEAPCGSSINAPDTLAVMKPSETAAGIDSCTKESPSPQALSEIVNSGVLESSSTSLKEDSSTAKPANTQEEKKDSSNTSALTLLQSLRLPFKPEDIEKLVASGNNCILVLAPTPSKPPTVSVAKIDETPLQQPPCPLPLFTLLDGKGGSSIEKEKTESISMGQPDKSSIQPSTSETSLTVQATSTSSNHVNLENKGEIVSSGVATQDKPPISVPGGAVADITNMPTSSVPPVLNTTLTQACPTPSNLHSLLTNPMQGLPQSSNIQQYQAGAYAQSAVSFSSSQQTYDAYQSWLASQGYQGSMNTNYGYGVDNSAQQSPMVYKQWEEYYRKMMEACQEGAARASAQSMFCPPSSLAEEQAKKSYSWVFEHPQHGCTTLQPTVNTTLLVTTPEIAKGSSPLEAATQQINRGVSSGRGRGRGRGRIRRCRVGLSSSLRESFVASAHLSCLPKPDNR
ncbi:Hypothetical protein NTJ_01797 [Nesidiocoris tenuis]|uniref:Uncharacterized protein n=1 Tax=Nesidiocoris tenuis TaxID=355587 RepID=A0ABN7A9K0_9HEMI|nr:Hypothetical protein NTJ_01797 [Nesidiocoris tenuis]